MAQAAARGQLDLHYQPLVDLRDHRIAGAEALMRWRHPRLGLLPPGQFGTVAKLAMRQPFVLFKGLTFQKLCL
ncbi:EAL domain-containing protein, partial [Escherichia coli]